jgi:hypothetical protein
VITEAGNDPSVTGLVYITAFAPGRGESVAALGSGDVLGRVTMQFFVRDDCAMIAASVQCDVDGIPQGPHRVSVTAQELTNKLATMTSHYAEALGHDRQLPESGR